MLPVILAIESSCDETCAAVIKNGKILANIIATQSVHKQYGGVVPELASRAHQQNIIPVVSQALQKAKISKNQLNAVAFTRGPGLLGPLLVGTSFAKAFALGLDIPLIEVDHMVAHILANFIPDANLRITDANIRMNANNTNENRNPKFPFLCLTVSGGHTQIVLVKDYLEMEIIGETLDDAVGEAFDKAAKLLGLTFPGGPALDSYAKKGDPVTYSFPDVNVPDLNFSFSGIKTALLYFLKEKSKANPNFINDNIENICASYQAALINLLLQKLIKASKKTGITEIAIAGGVSANSGLRKSLQEGAKKYKWNIYIPALEYCTDNAAMIAMAAHYKFLAGKFTDQRVSADPRLKIL